jgi:hypothetical protein
MPLPPGRGTCSIEGCDRDIHTNRGWCELHYQRWVRRGDAAWEPPAKVSTAACSVDGCDEPVHAKGLCRVDYHRAIYRARRLSEGRPEPQPIVRECDVCGSEYRRAGRRVLYCSVECRKTADSIRSHLRDYGLTKADFRAFMVKQGGACAICEKPERSSRKGILSVDHDHDTGRVRGLLCHACNVGLGHFRDDPALLARAAQYVGTA